LKRITEVKAGVVWWEFDDLVVDAMGDMIDVTVTIDHHAFQVVKVFTMTTGCFQRSQ